eukprot:5233467-Pyramimonas_sp.AAC.1
MSRFLRWPCLATGQVQARSGPMEGQCCPCSEWARHLASSRLSRNIPVGLPIVLQLNASP